MTKTRKSVLILLAVLAVAMLFVSCATNKVAKTPDQPIVVLYTNDVHCGYKDGIGYAGLAAYKKAVEANTDYVTLVDAGDAVQGDTIGTVSKGSYLVDIMNEVGYDFAVFGNHEFDYGTERLQELVEASNAQYLFANYKYTGKAGDRLKESVPYAIKKFGGVKVAFIGLSTPESIFKSTPKYFQEDLNKDGVLTTDEFVYDFLGGEDLYKVTQKYVDKVRRMGADYVIVVAHLGIEEASEPNRGTDLAKNTHGIDVIIDGHSHSVVESEILWNDELQQVLYTQTGTKFANLGVLTIGTDGLITTKLVQPTLQDPATAQFIAAIDKEYEGTVNSVVAKSDIALSINDANGARMVRNRETAIGDLCADAYRAMSGADVAFVNGGGIRASIEKGDLTLANIIKIHPYGNSLCMCEATGQQILDALEWGSKDTLATAANGANAVGESGGFLQVSGLKYTINTSIPNNCVKDEKGMFVRVDGARRVSDVYVGSEETGWEKLDPAKTYTLACHNYKLKDMGDGFTMFAANKFILDEVMIDNQVLINYICDVLGGTIGTEYSTVKGRITVK